MLLILLVGAAIGVASYRLFFEQRAYIGIAGPEDPLEAWSEADYVIWAYNSTFYGSRNMSTLLPLMLDDNLTYTCEMTDGNLTNGGLIFLKQVQKPLDYTPSANVTVWESYQDSVKIYTSSSSGKIGDCPTTANDTLTLQSGTSEQYLLNVTVTATTHFYNFFFDVNALTQNCTIKIYMQIAEGNWAEMTDMRKTALSTDDGLILKEFWADHNLRFTFQSHVSEGTTRSIPYRYFSEGY